MPTPVQIHARLESVQRQSDIDNIIIKNERINAGVARNLPFDLDGSVGKPGPVTGMTKTRSEQNVPRRFFADLFLRRSNDDGRSLGLNPSLQAVRNSCIDKKLAPVPIANSQELADVLAQAAGTGERTNFVRCRRQ